MHAPPFGFNACTSSQQVVLEIEQGLSLVAEVVPLGLRVPPSSFIGFVFVDVLFMVVFVANLHMVVFVANLQRWVAVSFPWLFPCFRPSTGPRLPYAALQ